MTYAKFKLTVCTVCGIIGGTIAQALGGWTNDMKILIFLMAADFITGLMLAGVFRNSNKSSTGALDSKASFKGLCKKCVIIMFIMVAHMLDELLGIAYLRDATVIGFITNEVLSLIENAGLMGITLPKPLMEAIEVLRNKNEEMENEHTKDSESDN